MVTLGDVQEDSVEEKDVGFDVQMLAPWEAQVEEELAEALILDVLDTLGVLWLLVGQLIVLTKVGIFSVGSVLLYGFPLNVNFPIFNRRLLSWIQIKIKNQRLLNFNIKVQILLFGQLLVVVLL